QRLAELFFRAALRLSHLLEQAGDLEGAIAIARHAVSLDALREEIQGDLIRLLIAAGQPSSALRQYRELERLLREELNVSPSASIRELVTRSLPGVSGHTEGVQVFRYSGIRDKGDQEKTDKESEKRPKTPTPEPPILRLPLQFTRFFG